MERKGWGMSKREDNQKVQFFEETRKNSTQNTSERKDGLSEVGLVGESRLSFYQCCLLLAVFMKSELRLEKAYGK